MFGLSHVEKENSNYRLSLITNDNLNQISKLVIKQLYSEDSYEKIRGEDIIFVYRIMNKKFQRFVTTTLIEQRNGTKYTGNSYHAMYAEYDDIKNEWSPLYNNLIRLILPKKSEEVSRNHLVWLPNDDPDKALNLIMKNKKDVLSQKKKAYEKSLQEYMELEKELEKILK